MGSRFAAAGASGAIAALLVACSSADHARTDSARSQGATNVAQQAAAPTPMDSGGAGAPAGLDSAPISTARAYLFERNYQNWGAVARGDSVLPACADRDDEAFEGVELNALWGIARARVLRVRYSPSDSTDVNVSAVVLRVLSVEGDPATSDGNYAKADLVIAQPILDTLWMSLHRTATGWVPCGYLWFLRDDVRSPIALTGPPADTSSPRGLPVSRWVPSRLGWTRVRAIADSAAQRK